MTSEKRELRSFRIIIINLKPAINTIAKKVFMIKNYQIHISGLVQGVWFRKYTFEEALKLQLKGFVRNEDHGGVYVEAEGEELQLKQLLEFLKKGSPLSKVKSVTYEIAPFKNYRTFEISR